jgi:polygalacturonase
MFSALTVVRNLMRKSHVSNTNNGRWIMMKERRDSKSTCRTLISSNVLTADSLARRSKVVTL